MLHDFNNLYTYLCYSEPDGEYAGPIIASPLSIHFARFDIYKNWDITKILVFEAFITYSLMFGNKFFRTQDKLIDDLRLTKYTLRKNRKSLIGDGYITKELGGETENYKNFYIVNYDKIIADVDKIYNLEVFDGNTQQGVRELYIDKFESFKSRSIKHEGRFPIFYQAKFPK